jgi:hypothetical protein
MLHAAHQSALSQKPDGRVHGMSRGPSGRIVVEFDPALKKRLHAALTLDGITLKDWFRQQAETYLKGHRGLAQGPSLEASPRPRSKKRGR